MWQDDSFHFKILSNLLRATDILERNGRLLGVPQHVLQTRQARVARYLRGCGAFVYVVENQLERVTTRPGRLLRWGVFQVHVLGAEVLGLAATHAVLYLAAVAPAVCPTEHASALCAFGAPEVVATTTATVTTAQASTDRDVGAPQHFAVLRDARTASAAPTSTRADCGGLMLLNCVRELLLREVARFHVGINRSFRVTLCRE
jgi:hypothetical protein